MRFSNPPAEAINTLLRAARIVAVVGLSDNPNRPSYDVASALLDYGYRVIPVNPDLTVWEGVRAVPDLDHLGEVLSPGEHVDIVNVFRRPEHVAGIVDDCIRLQLPALWLQLGVVDDAAAERATTAGITVVMNKCIKVERMRLR